MDRVDVEAAYVFYVQMTLSVWCGLMSDVHYIDRASRALYLERHIQKRV